MFWILLVPHEVKGDTKEVVDTQIDPCAVVACPASAVISTIPMIASWYDYDLKGYPDYSKTNATAASRDYPRGTFLLVCRADTGYADDCITVRVNDYGPDASVHPDRGLDLSSYAFQQIAPLSSGLASVTVRAVK
jgi:rare lipoprotein A (peptidoglycan hydrolase)